MKIFQLFQSRTIMVLIMCKQKRHLTKIDRFHCSHIAQTERQDSACWPVGFVSLNFINFHFDLYSTEQLLIYRFTCNKNKSTRHQSLKKLRYNLNGHRTLLRRAAMCYFWLFLFHALRILFSIC